MRSSPHPLLVAALPIAAGLFVACGDLPDVVPCGVIPDQGCPLGRGGTCSDDACAALYDCVDGAWIEVEVCDNLGQGGGGGDPAGGGGQGGACEGATIDKTGEALGCTPDLQPPDCSAAIAETCHPCNTGCLDFFLCTADGHEAVAYCDDEATLQLYP